MKFSLVQFSDQSFRAMAVWLWIDVCNRDRTDIPVVEELAWERKMKKAFYLVLILATLLLFFYLLIPKLNKVPYAAFHSPDGQFVVEVFSYKTFFGFPGQGGDNSGIIYFKTNSGKIVDQRRVAMVGNVDEPVWLSDRVEVKFVADWLYPAE